VTLSAQPRRSSGTPDCASLGAPQLCDVPKLGTVTYCPRNASAEAVVHAGIDVVARK